MKKFYTLVLLFGLILLPTKNLKAQFDPGDVAILENMMNNNFAVSNLLNWNDPNPGNWLGVAWNTATPRRVVQLDLLDEGGWGAGAGAGSSHNTLPFIKAYPGWIGNGVDAALIGNIDLSGLAELYAVDLRRQDSITGLNVSGLNNLEYVMFARNNFTTDLDFSNLPNLQQIHMTSMSALTMLNASNCPRLKLLKSKNNTLTSFNISGSDSLQAIVINYGDSGLNAIDLMGKTELQYLWMRYNDIQSLPGINTCSNLYSLKAAYNDNLQGSYNLSNYDPNLYKFSIADGKATSVTNWLALTPGSLAALNVSYNELTLTNATQVFNELWPNNNYGGSDQTRYGGDSIYVPTTVNHSAEALIDISGSDVASTFTLFSALGVQVGAPNTTGIFGFPAVADTGEYYIEMTNPGAAPLSNFTALTTNNFWVRCAAPGSSQTFTICDGDSVVVGTSVYSTTGIYQNAYTLASGCDSIVTTDLTVQAPIDVSTSVTGITISSNQMGATYQWVDCDNSNASIAGATDESYEPTANGNYAVEVTVNGCTQTSACVAITTVSIDALASSGVRVYPNPVSDALSIELDALNKNTSITILSVEGKKVYESSEITSTKTTVDTKSWKKGLYIVSIKNEQGTKTVKLVK